jgi:D-alanyl-D-alanine dipeptidase
MAEPMANSFTEAFDTLKTDFDIELQVQDTYRHPDAQQQSHEKYLKNIAAGKNVPKVATADSSFHTIGFAFDLAQTDEMKKNIKVIARELKKQGLVQHDDEWWHFSMEEVPENV